MLEKHISLYLFVCLLARRGGRSMLVPCDMEYPAFVSERTIKETVGNIECEGCVRYVQHSLTHKDTHISVCVDLMFVSLLPSDHLLSSRFPAVIFSWWS